MRNRDRWELFLSRKSEVKALKMSLRKGKSLRSLKKKLKGIYRNNRRCKCKTLQRIIRWKVDIESIVNTDWRHSYDWLVDLWYEKHYRVHHGENEFARWKQHINWIESFRSYCKRRMTKFNGVPKHKFELHLKECEFRFNCRLQKENIYNKLKDVLKNYTKAF